MIAEQVTTIRDYLPKDFEDLKRIHAQGGIDYPMPDVESPLFIIKQVVVDADDKVVCAVLFRVEVETYLLVDKKHPLSPAEKMQALEDLQTEALDALWMQGVNNAVAWIPENVEKFFAKRLTQLGWQRDRAGWHSWSRATEPKQ